ncbi:protein phosphatase 2C domain-containing protein [Pseudalkalibacillus caeni]|uniref:Protein phosphatase 2C domain-containing protein n=1 Tax=Exobacillus caeni TaxID=2574798 RepID=A0A5R9F480_9BACL|nr:protein phosphatase 2C domain-containing protein [Pseudalkalibacillus caeni]TLS37309.1 protein phosphatase 2C domain-containing protein [Pseudalkalibacillus caeni]
MNWTGSEERYLDTIDIEQVGKVTVGRYGGNTKAGAAKNEDGLLLWTRDEWEFAMLLDAHMTDQSARLLVETIAGEYETIKIILESEPVDHVFQTVENRLTSLLKSEEFLQKCSNVQGETACLICLRAGNYLWWLSVGDCVVYLLHPELKALGQVMLNQRNYFEWIGKVNTFSLPVPCYSSGIRELRGGLNKIVMLTDGVLEFGDRPYENQEFFYKKMMDKSNQQAVKKVLNDVQEKYGRDSATILAWEIDNHSPAQYPSDMK